MTGSKDTLTKTVLIGSLADVPDDPNIALEINDSLELEFIVVSANGQERILSCVILPDKREQIDTETNGH